LLTNHNERQEIRECITEVCRRFDGESWPKCETEVKFRFEFHCAMGEDGSLGATIPARVSTSQYQAERLLREVLVSRIALASEKLIRSSIAERMLDPPKSC
jgi:hypothetical protein